MKDISNHDPPPLPDTDEPPEISEATRALIWRSARVLAARQRQAQQERLQAELYNFACKNGSELGLTDLQIEAAWIQYHRCQDARAEVERELEALPIEQRAASRRLIRRIESAAEGWNEPPTPEYVEQLTQTLRFDDELIAERTAVSALARAARDERDAREEASLARADKRSRSPAKRALIAGRILEIAKHRNQRDVWAAICGDSHQLDHDRTSRDAKATEVVTSRKAALASANLAALAAAADVQHVALPRTMRIDGRVTLSISHIVSTKQINDAKACWRTSAPPPPTAAIVLSSLRLRNAGQRAVEHVRRAA